MLTAVITGGAGGIGLGIGKALAARGTVLAIGDIGDDRLEEAAARPMPLDDPECHNVHGPVARTFNQYQAHKEETEQ